MADFETIVEWISRNRTLFGYSPENMLLWERKANSDNGDVEKPYAFMIRRLMKNYQSNVEQCK